MFLAKGLLITDSCVKIFCDVLVLVPAHHDIPSDHIFLVVDDVSFQFIVAFSSLNRHSSMVKLKHRGGPVYIPDCSRSSF